ncbi:hypothetical protein QQX98_012593 [Neonectria punicea]|uniref:Zn(2)-C6 fungal-type domain-containing protein n=1 Tax=Neonectria punicea TaxID=979145 RepID=A0ABR1GIS2_9HYPO
MDTEYFPSDLASQSEELPLPNFPTDKSSPPLDPPASYHPSDATTASDAAPVERPYHSKRPHKKSRSGCRNCKARKVKCDVRGNTPNDFSTSSPAAGSQRHTPAPSDVVAQPLWCPSHINAADMKLLWFYTTTTSDSFSIGSHTPVDEILKVRMVQVAFEIPFLMDSLFALSSLHMQSLNQEYDQSRALAYRARSFEGYRRAVENAAPESYAALIANSLFLTALSSQAFRDEESKDLYIIDWMVVWRGIGLVIELMGVEKLFDTGLYELFTRPSIDLEAATTAIPNHLLFMVSSIKPDELDFADVGIYHEALKYLGSLYASLDDGLNPVMHLRIITWFTFLPRRFIELARQRRPRALIVIAYYAAFLKMVNEVWWIQGVGQRSLRDICKHLGPAWEHLLLMPQAAMEVDDELSVVRVILQDPTWVPPSLGTLRLDPSASIALVDDAGRRVAWTPSERRIVVLDSRPAEDIKWNT